MVKRKKRSGKNGKVIGLARDYCKGVRSAPYVLLISNGRGYLPDGVPKCIGDLIPFIERGSYGGITPSARENLLGELLGKGVFKKAKKLEIISI